MVQHPSVGASRSAMGGVVGNWASCVHAGHPGFGESQVYDVCWRGSALSGVSDGLGSVLFGYAFPVEGLVPGQVLMPCGVGQIVVMCPGVYGVGRALGVRA